MQLKSLKVFCDVVGWRSFSRAADENGISQSGASQVVHQLEERLGVKLIDRSKRPFRADARGRGLLRRLPQAGRSGTSPWKTRSARCTRRSSGRVRVASIYSVGLHHMNRYLQEFLSQYPKANVRLEYQHPHRVYEAVENDQADLGLVSYPRVVAHDRSHSLARRADGAGLRPRRTGWPAASRWRSKSWPART